MLESSVSLQQVLVYLETVVSRIGDDNVPIFGYCQTLRTVERFRCSVHVSQEGTVPVKNLSKQPNNGIKAGSLSHTDMYISYTSILRLYDALSFFIFIFIFIHIHLSLLVL